MFVPIWIWRPVRVYINVSLHFVSYKNYYDHVELNSSLFLFIIHAYSAVLCYLDLLLIIYLYYLDNLAEDLHRKLNHYSRRGAIDATAKPNKREKECMDKIINSVSSQMTTDDIDILYKFRYTLTENKKAIIKFMYSINWDEESEVAELPVLFNLWTQNAPVDIEDALKLLSKDKCFEHHYVREYAVTVLKSATDEELLTFLLQLVQALSYEPLQSQQSLGGVIPKKMMMDSDTPLISNNFNSNNSSTSLSHNENTTNIDDNNSNKSNSNNNNYQGNNNNNNTLLSPLANFLVERACASPIVANFFYWYVKVETEDEVAGVFFQTIFDYFIVQLSTSSVEGNQLFKRLSALDEYITKISTCQRDARDQGRRKEGKEEFLRKYLSERDLFRIPGGVNWVPMPLSPTIKLTGLIPHTASMFASAVYPCVIEFIEYEDIDNSNNSNGVGSISSEVVGNTTSTTSTTSSNISNINNSTSSSSSAAAAAVKKVKAEATTHKIMFKSGDDLRQDQLVMQLIALMDRLLKKVNLDLKLLTYGILAVRQNDGR
jgi:phosphatidylinositol 3-kinase